MTIPTMASVMSTPRRVPKPCAMSQPAPTCIGAVMSTHASVADANFQNGMCIMPATVMVVVRLAGMNLAMMMTQVPR